MSIEIREGRSEDAETCGRICYEAFHAISTAHGFPPDFPNAEVAIGLMTMLLAHPSIHLAVAQRGGEIVGSCGLDERGPVAGIGPITVAPQEQNAGVGRALMRYVMDRAARRGFPGIRLVQAAFHNRSLSLYTKLGFDPREPLSCIQGSPPGATIPGYALRAASDGDLAGCNRICVHVHGHTREGELREAIRQGSATVVEHDGRITGYATGIGFLSHAVGESNDEIKALIAAAPELFGPGVLVPTRNAELLRWCLHRGLRIVQPLTLMSVGLYSDPRGAYLPSILF
jgi:GNAT superfamily N-acetyltransferase